ncbi:UNVERIFIED_CONTAM: hypothetical protein FKN15_006376 [Acipenser sinensis]
MNKTDSTIRRFCECVCVERNLVIAAKELSPTRECVTNFFNYFTNFKIKEENTSTT